MSIANMYDFDNLWIFCKSLFNYMSLYAIISEKIQFKSKHCKNYINVIVCYDQSEWLSMPSLSLLTTCGHLDRRGEV